MRVVTLGRFHRGHYRGPEYLPVNPVTILDMTTTQTPKLAIDCMWLRRTIDSTQTTNPFLTLCSHIIRDGKACVGPFLDQMETDCRLWDPSERSVRAREARR